MSWQRFRSPLRYVSGMNRTRSQLGAMNNQLLIAIVVAVIVVLVLFFVLRDQGKDDKPNQPGVIMPHQVVSIG